MSKPRPAGSIPIASRPEASTPITSRPVTSIPVASRSTTSIPPALRRGISTGILTVTRVPSTTLSTSQSAPTPLPVESRLAAQDFHRGEAINTVDDDSREVNINDYFEADSEDVDNRIERNPAGSLKVDIKTELGYSKTDIEDYYCEPKRPLRKRACNQCDSVFSTSETLYRHKERCHPVKTEEKKNIDTGAPHRGSCEYSCDICTALFRYKRSLHNHLKQYHSTDIPLLSTGTIRYKCLECSKCEQAFYSIATYNKHLRDVHGEDVHVSEKRVSEKKVSEKRIMKKCPSCEQAFDVRKSSYKLVCHLRLIHHDEDLSSVIEELELGDKGRVVCQICGETKRNKHILASHIKTIHEESDELVPCHICGKLLRQNYGSMYSHHRSHHSGETTCKYCGKIFKNKVYARHHMKTHEPDFKKVECKECGAKFDTMGHLKDHRKYVHLQIKEAKCDICGKMFSTKSKMNIHRNSVHSQEKQFACEFCPFSSTRKDNLQAHRRKNHKVDDKTAILLKDKNETPQMPAIKKEHPTYLKVRSSDKTEAAKTQLAQLPAFLKDPLEVETPYAHHMGDFPTDMRTPQLPEMMRELQSSNKSQILQQPPSTKKEDMKNYTIMGDLSSYLKD